MEVAELVNNLLPSASAASCDLITVQLSKFAFLRKTGAEWYRYVLVVRHLQEFSSRERRRHGRRRRGPTTACPATRRSKHLHLK